MQFRSETSEDNFELIETRDGSFTLFNKKYQAHYHSLFGAKSESEYIFIRHSNLLELLRSNNEITILEIGLGTALNLLLTIREALKFSGTTVKYFAYEPEPIPPTIWKKFFATYDFPEEWTKPLLDKKDKFSIENISVNIFWKKWQGEILPEKANIIYYDAFGPKQHPEMWEEKLLLAAYKNLKNGGRLVTFSITGNTKRILKKHNIKFTRPKGFGKKREMLVISK